MWEQNGWLSLDGGVTIDSVHLKFREKSSYELTLHQMDVKDKERFSAVQFEIRAVILLLMQGPDHRNGKGTRQCFYNAFVQDMNLPSNNLCLFLLSQKGRSSRQESISECFDIPKN